MTKRHYGFASVVAVTICSLLLVSGCSAVSQQSVYRASASGDAIEGESNSIQSDNIAESSNDSQDTPIDLSDAKTDSDTMYNSGEAGKASNPQAMPNATRDIDVGAENFGRILACLSEAYENPASDAYQRIGPELTALWSTNKEAYRVANSIVSHWMRVYANPDYRINLHDDGAESADELKDASVPDKASHAFVVLGYALENGEMQDELRGRCEAAAAAARTFPHAIIVCSGGATGDDGVEGDAADAVVGEATETVEEPAAEEAFGTTAGEAAGDAAEATTGTAEGTAAVAATKKATEASLMKDYLTHECGIDESRVFIENRATSTAENALYTMDVLDEQGVDTVTIITSSYHQRRAQAVFNAVLAQRLQQQGRTIRITSNYNNQVETPYSEDWVDDRYAVHQIAEVLGLSEEGIAFLPPVE